MNNRFKQSRPIYAGLGLLAVMAITSCGPTDSEYRFRYRPITIPAQVAFTDSLPGHAFGGQITITRGHDDTYDSSAYILRWGLANGAEVLPDGGSTFITRIPLVDSNQGDTLRYDLAAPRLPDGVDKIVVYAANATGEALTGYNLPVSNLIANPGAPTARAYGIAFTDDDPGLKVRGSGHVAAASSPSTRPSNVTYFKVRYAGADGCPLSVSPVATLQMPNSSPDMILEFSIPSHRPAANVHSIVAIAGNTHGEAYEADCSNYVRASLNRIEEQANAPVPKRVLVSADTDPTEKLSVTITIEPDDERVVRDGYYVKWLRGDSCTASEEHIGFVSKSEPLNNGVRTITFSNLSIPENAGGFAVSAGSPCRNTNPDYEKVAFNNIIGPWYQIRLATPSAGNNGDECIAASYSTDELVIEGCNASKLEQRFEVTNIPVTGNDDFHQIRSLARNMCFYRSDSDESERWNLKPCDNSRNQQMELKAESQDTRTQKKIAVRKEIAGLTWWSCAWHPTWADRLVSTWGNCGATAYDIRWYFVPGGTTNSTYYAVFNDPWN